MKKGINNYNSLLIEALSEKPIAFNPMLAKIAGSALAGLFLSQMLYWRGKGINRIWIYKTIADLRSETAMTRSEQNRAIRIWRGLGILEVQLWGLPRRRHFKINIKNLTDLIKCTTGIGVHINTSQFAKSSKQVGQHRQNKTESTTKKTYRDFSLQERSEKSIFDEIDFDKIFTHPNG